MLALIAATLMAVALPLRAEERRGNARVVVLMVWDGLRPDFVTQRDTPNLFAMARDGVRFDRHHSIYPTLTMVNAAALATGGPPALNGIYGDAMDFAPELAGRGAPAPGDANLKAAIAGPVDIEDSELLAALNGAGAFAGRFLGLDTVGQEVERDGGYLAVIGKRGPTLLFDDRVAAITDGHDSLLQPHKNYLFVADDMAEPPSEGAQLLAALPARNATGVSDRERDAYFARLVAEKALPAAKLAADAGHPALVVFWQHNPDITQHRAGLGTLPAIEALGECDTHLGTIRAALDGLGVANRSDLIVVSDHGFATIQISIALDAQLVAAGLKKSRESSDVVVAANGGSDLIYLSRTDFPTVEARHDILQKIVNFAEAQEWCGPIFSREAALPDARGRAQKPYLGWIDGTFAQSDRGLFNTARSPDLVLSFREMPDLDNKAFTGPLKPAFVIGSGGQRSVPNKSQELVRPVKVTVYADAGDRFTAGMGMHGAAGTREIHNFCAAAGPDFRRAFVDRNPTSNSDVAPTITQVLGLPPNVGPNGVYPSGRAMTEALSGGKQFVGAAHAFTMKSELMLQGVEVIGTLRATRLGDRVYLDDAALDRKPLGNSP